MTLITRCALGMLGMLGVAVAAAGDSYLKDPITGCQVWTDKIDPAGEVVSWNGQCVGGKANGEGTLSWFRGGKLVGRYQGGMAYGKLHGAGILHYTAKDGYNRYEGDFVNGELSGQLAYEGVNGDHFEGTVEQDGKKGQGVFVDADGNWYKGELQDGLYHGKGVLVMKKGGSLEGHFVAGKAHGKGIYSAPDGVLYQANFVEGKLDGKVVVTRPDGSREEQQWKMDKRVQPSTSEEKK